MSHDVAMSNAKVDQEDFLMTVPVARRLPQTNGWPQMTQFIAICNTLTSVGLPSGVDRPLKQTEVAPKRESEVYVWGLVCDHFGHCISPFITRKAHMRGDPVEGN